MHFWTRTFFAATVASGIATPAFCQNGATPVPINQFQGMFTGEAVGVQLVDDGFGNPAVTNPMRIRLPGMGPQNLRIWTENRFGNAAIDHPNYSQSALFDDWMPTLLPGWTPQSGIYPVLGSMSTGGDVCPPIEETLVAGELVGRLMTDQPVGAGWYSLSIVVDPQSQGVQNSLINDEWQNGDASGAIFSYYVEGSEGIQGGFVDTNRIEYVRAQTNFPTGTGPGNVGISALDWGMGIISTTENGVATEFQPQRNCFYFTFDADWLAPFGTALQMPGGGQPDPATIYVMEWNGNRWLDPVVAFSRTDLFGSAQEGVQMAIDGIAVHHEDFNNASSAANAVRVVFSLSPGSEIDRNGTTEMNPNQILVSQRTWNGNPPVYARPLATELGDTVSSKMGVSNGGPGTDPDNVRGLCGRDPKEQDGRDLYVGYPSDNMQSGDAFGAPYGPLNIGLGMFRYNDVRAGRGDLLLQVSGVDQLLPYEIGVLFFDMEVIEVFQDGGVRSEVIDTILNVPVDYGSLTQQYSLPFTYIPPAPTAPNSRGYEFRVRARLHGLNIFDLTDVRMNIGSSWTSTIRL